MSNMLNDSDIILSLQLLRETIQAENYKIHQELHIQNLIKLYELGYINSSQLEEELSDSSYAYLLNQNKDSKATIKGRIK